MPTPLRRRLLLAGLIIGTLAGSPIISAQAEDAPKTAEKATTEKPATDKPAAPATAPTTARSREAIIADLNAASTDLRAAIPSPEVLSDAKKREEVAPKAIPAMKTYFNWGGRLTRIVIAYFVGLNVWGLVLALSFVVSGLTHMDIWIPILGLFGGVGAGFAAGRWVYRSLHWVHQ